MGWSAQLPLLENVRTEITRFIDGIKGLEFDDSVVVEPDLELSGFLFEQTGSVIQNSLSGEIFTGEFLTGGALSGELFTEEKAPILSIT